MEDYMRPRVQVLLLLYENPICTNSDESEDSVFEDPFVKPPFEW